MYAAVRPLADSDSRLFRQLAEVSLGVPSEPSAAFVFAYLKTSPELNPGQRNEYLHHVVRRIAADDLPQVYALTLALEPEHPRERADLVRAVGRGLQARGAEMPAEIAERARQLAAELLSADQEDSVRVGLELARDLLASAGSANS
jgi:hypothetical protein